MIYVLHGEDAVASREKLQEFLKSTSNVFVFDLDKSSGIDIFNAFEAKSLFQDKKIIILQDIKSTSIKPFIAKILTFSNSKDTDIVLWHDDAIDKRLLEKLIGAKVTAFTLPKYLFPFLDNLMPGNGSMSFETFQKLKEQVPPELIFYHIIKRIRVLLMLSYGNQNSFSETSSMQGWQIQKLESQLKNWDKNRLLGFFRNLFELEIGAKTSTLPLSFSDQLDMLIKTKL
ncbi:MAG: hypothetical protein COX79_03170 [Candidatus Levybacteria bacterium CG_4_10_14_0_2_um_filter_36_16]|nr:MAG: hypothetical protein AUK12_05340 [Candidatus Levybacteria bacterium CG2_30_37_29]PIR79029.1 MAG: hypothetical protein COU26_03325 [Candidatus Levybacteria bacterium CG10_big_fil_rev_8_21_14_0_10_36_30]PIZ97164.1 MAG: hypothetical protein COX79_03170 [Candidatus Levybacteria bacterium CG_4_10_14_0_2_um_filter_36_16]PJA90020.1 MAG: hypothetical protein CO136_03405 [Candidatus Levybacteria bacterium CG_4_9_14_3_um_filter_36_7]